MDFSTLKQLAEVYPMLIKPFKGLSDPSDSDITLKINTIVQYLNQIGQVSNDTVNSWNKVMVWTMDEGLTDSVNAKIDDMVANGSFNDLLTSLTNTLLGSEVLGTVSQDVKGAINEVLGIANANALALGSEALVTANKDVKGAINEVKGIADANTSALAEITTKTNDPKLLYKGANIEAHRDNGVSFGDSALVTTFTNFQNVGGNALAFIPIWSMSDPTSGNIDLSVVNETGLETCIANTKAMGFKTMMKPHIDTSSGRWNITAVNNLSGWFTAYTGKLTMLAGIAQRQGMDIFCIGCELSGLSNNQAADSYWRQLITTIRGIFSGKIVYAAKVSEFKGVTFWDAVDYIGLNPYYTLTDHNDPTESDLKSAWYWNYATQSPSTNPIQEIINIQTKYQKRVIITEIGYVMQQGCNMNPESYTVSTPYFSEQTTCYKIAEYMLRNLSFVDGIFLYSIQSPNEPYSHSMDLFYNSTLISNLTSVWKGM